MSERVFLARFASAEALVAAARAARAAGFPLHEAWSPVPIGELEPLLEARPHRVAWIALLAAAVGSAGAFALQRYAALVSWPVGSLEPTALAHLPVALAVGAMGAAVAASLCLFASIIGRRRNASPDDGAFALAFSLRGSRFDREEAIALLDHHGATAMGYAEVPR